jgi:hypothetical protein
MTNDQIEAALNVLDVLTQRQAVYHKLSSHIEAEMDSDFGFHIPAIDGKLYEAVMELLNTILPFQVGAYYQREGQSGDGGWIEDNGVRYPIRTIDDVRAFVLAMRDAATVAYPLSPRRSRRTIHACPT